MINRFFDTPAHDHQTVSYDATDGFPMSWESTPPPAPTHPPTNSAESDVTVDDSGPGGEGQSWEL